MIDAVTAEKLRSDHRS